jgi:transcriptional regulator of arginine metabolism
MTSKIDRQKRILDLVHATPIATQAELQMKLKASGLRVDQATLSRDIHELGLVKVAANGGYRYAPLEEASPTVPLRSFAMMKRFVRDIEASGNLIVVKTDTGAASPVGEALDRLAMPEILGTVAGDNTLLVVVRGKVRARQVVARLQKHLR